MNPQHSCKCIQLKTNLYIHYKKDHLFSVSDIKIDFFVCFRSIRIPQNISICPRNEKENVLWIFITFSKVQGCHALRCLYTIWESPDDAITLEAFDWLVNIWVIWRHTIKSYLKQLICVTSRKWYIEKNHLGYKEENHQLPQLWFTFGYKFQVPEGAMFICSKYTRTQVHQTAQEVGVLCSRD